MRLYDTKDNLLKLGQMIDIICGPYGVCSPPIRGTIIAKQSLYNHIEPVCLGWKEHPIQLSNSGYLSQIFDGESGAIYESDIVIPSIKEWKFCHWIDTGYVFELVEEFPGKKCEVCHISMAHTQALICISCKALMAIDQCSLL